MVGSDMKIIIRVIIVAMLSVFLSIALESNENQTININYSIENQSVSRFYLDRSNFETNLIHQAPSPQKYENELPPAGVREVQYNSSGLILRAWLSEDPGDNITRPAVVYAHGGFAFGESDWRDAQKFIDQGFILMTPMLRGENGNPGNFEFFYGEVEDLIAAADYLSNVSYVDRDKIFLCGHSSGGTLSILTSMMPSKYKSIASFGGSPDQKSFFNSGWWRSAPFDIKNSKEIELRSPLAYTDSIVKPLLIYVGDMDSDYLSISKRFVEEAKKYNCTCEAYIIKGDHFTSLGEAIMQSAEKFRKI